MKRVLTFIVLVALFAGQASAGLWMLDRPTALGLTSSTVTTGFATANTLSVYDGPSTKVFGPGPALYGPMSGQVGFYAGLAGDAVGGTATMNIYDPTPSLSDVVTYDGVTVYVQNDNQSKWSYQLFYVDSAEGLQESAWVELLGLGHSTYLTSLSDAPGSLDLGNITSIGIRVKGENMGGADAAYPSYSDDFHVSLVPVPGAVLLGWLGLTAAGLKLRRRV